MNLISTKSLKGQKNSLEWTFSIVLRYGITSGVSWFSQPCLYRLSYVLQCFCIRSFLFLPTVCLLATLVLKWLVDFSLFLTKELTWINKSPRVLYKRQWPKASIPFSLMLWNRIVHRQFWNKKIRFPQSCVQTSMARSKSCAASWYWMSESASLVYFGLMTVVYKIFVHSSSWWNNVYLLSTNIPAVLCVYWIIVP